KDSDEVQVKGYADWGVSVALWQPVVLNAHSFGVRRAGVAG
ncbi:MAG: hypothetical protein ACI9R8_000656, partial [Candidatus Paceibacteria bacterium]